MSYFSYIGKLNSPNFFWDDIPDAAYRRGNTPNRIIPEPPGWAGLGFAPGLIRQWSEAHGLPAKQTDWGAWCMIVRKPDIQAIWQEEKPLPNRSPSLEKEWESIRYQIEKLSDEETYVLVVAENP
jgi:hypothetical protein